MNNNITEDYCSFEVSKLLKEKGFTVECTHRYNTSFNGLEFEMADYANDWNTNYLSKPYFLSAPTHALAIKWIRENFGIHIEIRHIKTFGINRFHIIIWKYGEKDYHTIHCDNKIGYEVWDKPEEATEAALLYTLKHLI